MFFAKRENLLNKILMTIFYVLDAVLGSITQRLSTWILEPRFLASTPSSSISHLVLVKLPNLSMLPFPYLLNGNDQC